MDTRTVRGGGVELRVADTGSGRPILFLHGYSQSRMCWRKQTESTLKDEFRLVTMDLRGHGQSEKPHDAYDDSTSWADDVRAVITELELEDVLLVAWSYAGLVALDYLDQYGTDRIAGVNFVGIVAEIGTESGTAVLGQQYIDLLPGFVATDTDESVETMADFVRLCVHEELPCEEFYYMLGYNVVVPPRVRDALRSRTVSHTSVLAELDVPVLLSHGEEDAVVLAEAATNAESIVEDAETSFYPTTGHSPFWERPDRFNDELRSFASEL